MDNDTAGITFNCIKNIYNKFDIIELERKPCDEDGDEFSEPFGYDELALAMQTFPKIPNLDTSMLKFNDRLLIFYYNNNYSQLTTKMMKIPKTSWMSRKR
jgi:hypothetical protein